MWKLCVVLLLVQYGIANCTPVSLSLLMPNVSPQQHDLYLCHRFELDQKRPVYITKFHPNATKQTAHHILLYSCAETINEELWNCGEMNMDKNSKNQFKPGPVCTKAQNIIYAWASDAPELVLPKDVAFKLGGDTDRKILVLQVHYGNIDRFLDGTTDNSGVILTGQYEPLPYAAGVHLSATGGYIQPQTEDYFEAACQMKEDVEIHPFAFRTHAHGLGLVNSGYVVKQDDKTGEQQWIEIGRRSPQLPQMFYPVTNKVVVKKGDILAARCTMENTRDHVVSIGQTNEDEMCNFYIMYYVKGPQVLENNVCFSSGPPFWYFKDFRGENGKHLDLSAIPSDISEVPKMTEEEMHQMAEHLHGHVGNKQDNMAKMNHQHDSNEMESNEHESSEENAADSDVESNESTPDEYESGLDDLEKELYYKDLLRKYLLKNKNSQ